MSSENAFTISSERVYFTVEDDAGIIWAGSANGISKIDPQSGEIRRFMDDQDQKPTYGHPLNILRHYIPPGENSIMWLATGNGLVKFDRESEDYERFLIEPNKNGINPLNFLNDLRPDPNDPFILWAGGSRTGIVRFDMRTEQFFTYRSDPGDKYSLNDNDIASLHLDRSGIMWAGTTNEGINKFNPGAVNFRHIRPKVGDPSSLPFEIVWGIFEDHEGSLWVGTFDGPGTQYLTRFNGVTRKVLKYRHNPNDPDHFKKETYGCLLKIKRIDFGSEVWEALVSLTEKQAGPKDIMVQGIGGSRFSHSNSIILIKTSSGLAPIMV